MICDRNDHLLRKIDWFLDLGTRMASWRRLPNGDTAQHRNYRHATVASTH
jgi:hypothetical protein